MKGRVRDTGILLKVANYSESSLILQALCGERGLISILAKGQRSKERSAALVTLGEYEFVLYEPMDTGMYLLAEASPLGENILSANPEAWTAGMCGAELLQAILVPPHEHAQYLALLRSYLDYLGKVPRNSILIFWRLWRKVMELLGVPLDLCHCAICGATLVQPAIARSHSGEMLCADCAAGLPSAEQLVQLPSPIPEVLANLDVIGTRLGDFRISRNAAHSLNSLLLAHFSTHLQHELRLKSLPVLEQFYP